MVKEILARVSLINGIYTDNKNPLGKAKHFTLPSGLL